MSAVFVEDISRRLKTVTPIFRKSHRGSVRDTLEYHFHPLIWSVGVPLSGSLGWGHISTYPISENVDPKNK